MLSMRDILIVRDTFVLIKVRGIICRSGIEEWNQRLLKKGSFVSMAVKTWTLLSYLSLVMHGQLFVSEI